MYRALGANWAGTLLGVMEALFIPIPFIFYRYGHKIREKSTLIRQMAEDQRRREAKQKRAVEKVTRRAEAEIEVGGAMSTGAALTEKFDMEKDIERGHAKEL